MKRIGYLGPIGTFTEQAFKLYIGKEECSPLLASSIDELFDLFNEDKADEILLPIENSIGGPVIRCMDLLAKSKNGYISYELILRINHCLLAKRQLETNEISHVLSKDQAIMQCWPYIHDNLSHVETVAVNSTATAADWISNPEKCPSSLEAYQDSMTAIGPTSLAEKYPLVIIKENIQENPLNQTRFIVISHKKSPISDYDKTSLIFSAHHKPGSLYKILSEFEKENLNLTQIASRPIQEKPGTYYFYIDFEGHQDDKRIKDVLKKVKAKTTFFKILGSYAKGIKHD